MTDAARKESMTTVTPGREELAIEVMNVRRRIHGLDDLDLATLRRIKRDAGINEAFAIADALLARLAAKPNEEGVRVWLREIDAHTDNACWVVCNRVDPGAVEFLSTTGVPEQ